MNLSRLQRFVIAISVFCITALSMGGALAEGIRVTIAAGPPKSTYAEVGNLLKDLGPTFGLDVTVITTNGSWQNLELIDSAVATFALAQQDALSRYYSESPRASVKVIRGLYFEFLHVIVRPLFGISRASQIRGLRVFPGLPGSGTAVTTHNFLDAVGISRGHFTAVDVVDFLDVPRLLHDDSLDVAMYVGMPGTFHLDSVMRTGGTRLLSLDAEATKSLALGESSRFGRDVFPRTIPKNTYSNQPSAVRALAVPVLLVTNTDTPADVVMKFDSVLQVATARLKESKGERYIAIDPNEYAHRFPSHPAVSASAEGMDVDLFPWLSGVILLTALGLLWMNRVSIYRWASQHQLIAIVTPTAVVLVFCLLGAYNYENEINENFSNVPEAGWSILVYLFSGLEDRVPYTVAGRLFCLGALVLSPILGTVVTGMLASRFVIKGLEGRVCSQLANHYVIINWNPRAMQIVKQLRSENGERTVITVITDDPAVNFKDLGHEFREGRTKAYEDVYFCPGDPGTREALLNANVEESRAIIVLGDDRDGESDEKTLRILYALKHIAIEYKRSDMKVTAEIRNIENTDVIEEFASSFPGVLDYVTAGLMRTMLLAQCAVNPGMSGVYRELLRSGFGCEIYRVRIPAAADGYTFPEYLDLCTETSGPDDVIPIGVGREIEGRWQFDINPLKEYDKSPNPLYTLRAGDFLICIAYDMPRENELPIPEVRGPVVDRVPA